MTRVTPTPIPPHPELPQRSDRTTFASRADDFVDWEANVLAPGIETLAGQTFENATDAYESAGQSDAHANRAEAAADSASQTAGAEEWVSGQTYPKGVAVWSPLDMQTYRRRVAGAGTLDPSLDPANWTQIGGTSLGDLHANALSF